VSRNENESSPETNKLIVTVRPLYHLIFSIFIDSFYQNHIKLRYHFSVLELMHSFFPNVRHTEFFKAYKTKVRSIIEIFMKHKALCGLVNSPLTAELSSQHYQLSITSKLIHHQ